MTADDAVKAGVCVSVADENQPHQQPRYAAGHHAQLG
jgi:hypothetical protein